MRSLLIGLIAATLWGTTVLNGQAQIRDFTKLSASPDSSYGRVITNPIPLKRWDQGNSMANAVVYLNGLRTSDNQSLRPLARITIANPNYRQPSVQFMNRYTGLPVSGKLGLLDKYVFVTSTTRDTVVLYVDIYNRGRLALPTGFRYEQGIQ